MFGPPTKGEAWLAAASPPQPNSDAATSPLHGDYRHQYRDMLWRLRSLVMFANQHHHNAAQTLAMHLNACGITTKSRHRMTWVIDRININITANDLDDANVN
jgi:hypothetical protein